jgi:hypothetical protein
MDSHRAYVDSNDPHRPAGHVFVRTDLGVQLRVTPRFAFQPFGPQAY